MKLKTKFQDDNFNFGEVINANIYYGGYSRIKLIATAASGVECTFYIESLKGLNEMFEDYEEPKEYWYIDWNGEVCRSDIHDERTNQMKQIGNYFETREEAEKAVEKLKAWKRLKDNHFKFLNVKNVTPDVPIDKYYVHIEAKFDGASLDDMRLLFGGEE